MKILYAIPAPYAMGGIGNIAQGAVREIHRAGHLQYLMTSRSAKTELPKEKVLEFPWANMLGRFWNGQKTFDWLIKDRMQNADIAHIWNLPGTRSAAKAKANGLKLVIDRASTHPIHQFNILKNEYENFGLASKQSRVDTELCLKQLDLADAVIVPSEQAKESFKQQEWKKDNIHVIPFGVDLQRFKSTHEKNKNELIILFVGQISLRKGVQYLLPAFDALKLPKAKLILLGPVMADMNNIVANFRNRPNIEFAGARSDTEKYYQRADFCVFPSIEEGSALVSYEALACSCPSIVTPEVGAILEHKKEGLIIPAKDMDALKTAMELLYRDTSLRKFLADNCLKKAEAFSWENYGRSIITLYQKLLSI